MWRFRVSKTIWGEEIIIEVLTDSCSRPYLLWKADNLWFSYGLSIPKDMILHEKHILQKPSQIGGLDKKFKGAFNCLAASRFPAVDNSSTIFLKCAKAFGGPLGGGFMFINLNI